MIKTKEERKKERKKERKLQFPKSKRHTEKQTDIKQISKAGER